MTGKNTETMTPKSLESDEGFQDFMKNEGLAKLRAHNWRMSGIQTEKKANFRESIQNLPFEARRSPSNNSDNESDEHTKEPVDPWPEQLKGLLNQKLEDEKDQDIDSKGKHKPKSIVWLLQKLKRSTPKDNEDLDNAAIVSNMEEQLMERPLTTKDIERAQKGSLGERNLSVLDADSKNVVFRIKDVERLVMESYICTMSASAKSYSFIRRPDDISEEIVGNSVLRAKDGEAFILEPGRNPEGAEEIVITLLDSGQVEGTEFQEGRKVQFQTVNQQKKREQLDQRGIQLGKDFDAKVKDLGIPVVRFDRLAFIGRYVDESKAPKKSRLPFSSKYDWRDLTSFVDDFKKYHKRFARPIDASKESFNEFYIAIVDNLTKFEDRKDFFQHAAQFSDLYIDEVRNSKRVETLKTVPFGYFVKLCLHSDLDVKRAESLLTNFTDTTQRYPLPIKEHDIKDLLRMYLGSRKVRLPNYNADGFFQQLEAFKAADQATCKQLGISSEHKADDAREAYQERLETHMVKGISLDAVMKNFERRVKIEREYLARRESWGIALSRDAVKKNVEKILVILEEKTANQNAPNYPIANKKNEDALIEEAANEFGQQHLAKKQKVTEVQSQKSADTPGKSFGH